MSKRVKIGSLVFEVPKEVSTQLALLAMHRTEAVRALERTKAAIESVLRNRKVTLPLTCNNALTMEAMRAGIVLNLIADESRTQPETLQEYCDRARERQKEGASKVHEKERRHASR